MMIDKGDGGRQIICVGECMIEVSVPGGNQALLGYGGDTLNTAVYLSRLGAEVAYATALGDDAMSLDMRKFWQDEGIDTSLVTQSPGKLPGLYMIRTDAQGERTFAYWREQSAARALFTLPDTAALVDALVASRAIYFSGITLSILSETGRAVFRQALAQARERGAMIIFDGNYRPRGWPGASRAQEVFNAFLPLCTMALPTFDDEQLLFGDKTAMETAQRIHKLGVREVVVKQGAKGVLILHDGETGTVPVPRQVRPVDTTAAGDSFNAGYIISRVRGESTSLAAVQGHRLAGLVIMHRGAIIPRKDMPV